MSKKKIGGRQDPVTTHTITDHAIACTAVVQSRLRPVVGEDQDIAVDFLGARIVKGGQTVKELNSKEAENFMDQYQRWQSNAFVYRKTKDGTLEIDEKATAARAKSVGSVSSSAQTKVGAQVVDGDVEPITVPRVPNNPLEKHCGPNLTS